MKLNKILIIGGTHGNEKTGVDVVRHLKNCTVKNIDTLIANPRAVSNNCRFMETDLNRSFNLQKKQSYEEKRTVFISKKMKKYDFIIEFHNTNSMTNCVIITNKRPTILQSKIIKYFGFKHVIVMPPKNSLSSQNPSKTVSFEISTKNGVSSVLLLKKILSIKNEINNYDFRNFTIYKYSGTKIYKNILQKVSLKIEDFTDFYPIKKKNSKILGLKPDMNIPFLIGGTSYGKDFGFCVAKVIK